MKITFSNEKLQRSTNINPFMFSTITFHFPYNPEPKVSTGFTNTSRVNEDTVFKGPLCLSKIKIKHK